MYSRNGPTLLNPYDKNITDILDLLPLVVVCRPPLLALAHPHQILRRQRSTKLLETAAFRYPAEIDWIKTQSLAQVADRGGRIGVFGRHENDAPAACLGGIARQDCRHERVERLHDARTGNRLGHDLAGWPPAQVRWREGRKINGVRSIHDDAASPVGYRADCVRHRRERNRQDHDVRTGGFLDGDVQSAAITSFFRPIFLTALTTRSSSHVLRVVRLIGFWSG